MGTCGGAVEGPCGASGGLMQVMFVGGTRSALSLGCWQVLAPRGDRLC